MPDGDINAQAKAALPQPKLAAPWEEEPRLNSPPTSKLGQAYEHAKQFLSTHEQHLSEKVLKPFREGLDNMASDLEEAGESGHTKSGGQLTGPTRALASGTGALLRMVPVGSDVKSTAMAAMTPPELKEEGLDFSKLEGHTIVKPAAKYGEETFFHGTKAPIKSITKADPLTHGDAGALAGIGTYLTDKPEVASGYAVGKRAGSVAPEGSRVLAGKLRSDAKILDLDKPAPKEIRDTFSKQIRGIFHDTDVTDAQLEHDYFRSPGDKGEKAVTGNDMFDGVRRALAEEGYSKSDAIEVMQDIATKIKHTHGYDVLQYEGGKRIPRYGSHKAIVVLPDMLTGQMPEGILKDTVPSKSAADFSKLEGHSEIKSTPKDVVEKAGLKYKGEVIAGSGVHMFEHPDHPGKTAALNEHQITPENVKEKMKAKIKEFEAAEKAKKEVVAKGTVGL